MKILAIEKEKSGLTKKDFYPFLKPEAEKVWQLYKDETIREIYFDNERSSAILILECKDKNEAQQILSELPLVKENLIVFELFNLNPYTGFARLFK